MRISLRSILMLGSLSLAAFAGGTSVAAPGVESPAPASPASPDAPDSYTPVYGSVAMLADALDEITLRSDQADAIAALGLAIAPFEHAVDQAENAMLSALAAQVRDGKIDRSALQSYVDDYVQARQRFADPFRVAVGMLHLFLDPQQRADFADALEARVHDAVSTELSQHQLDQFEEALGADAGQRARIEQAFAEIVPTLQAEREAVHAAIEGFRHDSFDLEDYLPENDVVSRAQTRAGEIIDATEEVLSALDENQRHMLADRIEAAARVVGETHPAAPAPAPLPRIPRHHPGPIPERTAQAEQHIWLRGYGYGPWGRRGLMVAPGAWFGARMGAFPIAAGWGLGW